MNLQVVTETKRLSTSISYNLREKYAVAQYLNAFSYKDEIGLQKGHKNRNTRPGEHKQESMSQNDIIRESLFYLAGS